MKPLRHWGFLLALVLALAWGQQAAVRHSLAHATGQHRQDPAKPAPAHCDQCGLFAELTGAVGIDAASAPVIPADRIAASPRPSAPLRLAPRLAFHPRGPPAAA